MDKDSDLIHSVVVTAANVHNLTPASELLQGDEDVVDGDTGYQGIAERTETADKTREFSAAMRPGKRRVLPDTAEARLRDLIGTTKVHIRCKVENRLRVVKQQLSLQKTRLRGIVKKLCKMSALAAQSNVFLVRRQLLATS